MSLYSPQENFMNHIVLVDQYSQERETMDYSVQSSLSQLNDTTTPYLNTINNQQPSSTYTFLIILNMLLCLKPIDLQILLNTRDRLPELSRIAFILWCNIYASYHKKDIVTLSTTHQFFFCFYYIIGNLSTIEILRHPPFKIFRNLAFPIMFKIITKNDKSLNQHALMQKFNSLTLYLSLESYVLFSLVSYVYLSYFYYNLIVNDKSLIKKLAKALIYTIMGKVLFLTIEVAFKDEEILLRHKLSSL